MSLFRRAKPLTRFTSAVSKQFSENPSKDFAAADRNGLRVVVAVLDCDRADDLDALVRSWGGTVQYKR